MSYRFGFNGQEKQDELHGNSGDAYDFGARMYDARLGRWLSMDPLQVKYPTLSPYNFTADIPILFVDHNGKEIIIYYTAQVTQADGSITETPAPYTYGSGLAVPNNEFVQKTCAALVYAATNDPNSVIVSLEGSTSITWKIEETTGTNPAVDDATGPAPSFDANGNVTHTTCITKWNPNLGLITTDDGAISPSTILYHEGAHTLSIGSSKTKAEYDQKFAALTGPLLKYFDIQDDLTVITKFEDSYVKNVNANEAKKYNQNLLPAEKTLQQQGVRSNHRGTFYYTKGVNSIEPGAGNPPPMKIVNGVQHRTTNGGALSPGMNAVDLNGKEHSLSGVPEKVNQ
ncbi:hypothetical protein BH09BAC5_BH09BAC5_10770 [soil metagenome]